VAVVGVVAGWAPSAAAQALSGDQLPVRDVTLDNGLRLLVLPRHAAPTVSFVVRYEVGGVNEHLGNTGIAHLLEHLMFKGTTTIGTRNLAEERRLFRRMDALQDTLILRRAETRTDSAAIGALARRIHELEDSARAWVESNEFDRILTRNGARSLNATTTNDATTYFVELPANRIQLWFVLEADRMVHPVFREFYTERDVVMEERRTRVETSPGGLLNEVHLAHAFTMHPYGVPVAGYMSDLAFLTRHQVRDYYRRYYGPNNATVAIVGDVDPDRVVELARRYLGPVPRGDEPDPVLAVEPPQLGERRVEVTFDAEPRLKVGWHVPDAFHPDAAALSVASALLTGGRTSRLYRRLVLEERLVTSVSSVMGPGERFPRLFQVDAVPRSPHTPAEVEAAIYDELARLGSEPPEDAELERVRNQVEAGAVRRLTSNLGLAFQLAASASLWGDWRTTFELTRRFEEVTPEDVSRVIRAYLTSRNRTVAVLHRAEGATTEAVGGTGSSGGPTGAGGGG
jgi:predicted Zn-dependent peptidase